MNKKALKKETSAIFLAIVLVLGTIALTVPSFSVEAQATSDREKDYDHDKKDYYEKDRDYESRDHDEKKSYDKDDYKSDYSSYGKYDRDYDKSKKDSNSVSIKKVKCNNINVNLNGIDVNIGGLPNNVPVTNPVAVAQEVDDDDDDDETESNSIESDNESYDGRDGKSDSNTNSKIVCINNNNNIVVEEQEEEEQDPCIACFEKFFTPELFDESFDEIVDFCQEADAGAIIDETTFRISLEIVGVEDIDGLIDCLEDAGVEFFTSDTEPDT